ncbi:hypothetical protein CONLIGDRAFT_299624 [Coniochaeta ligniaria NRRL 30616]|uniref:Uncharacterized protein n=1 Tax=Coniochaeta ligniaria NRRL 30616 TaxID=1408157 RepID=A0A1J7JTN2_9PEZI|nr:hypothetical protein CONLIGDRAFT_299624 [Coniochaeta ligniaria NRRL 30616]
MSHRQPAGRHGDGSPEDEEFNGAHVSPHGDGTEEHDQIVFTQSTEAPWPSSASVEGDHPEHLDTPHAAAFTPSYLTSPALTAQTAETLVTSDSEGGWSLLPTNRMSVQTALTPVGLSDASTITGSEHSHRKAPAPGWQSFSQAFQPALQGAAHDSLTVRDITPPAISSEGFDATDFASQSSISRSRLPTLYSEPDFEGISLQSKPFRRPPRSQRSSNASSTTTRRAPGLLTPMPNRRGRATRIFADPLAAPSADLDFGLPSIRHIIDSDDGIDGGINPEQPTAFKDNALVNHLEEFQREATARWDKTKGASEHDREIIVSDLVTRLWQTSVNYLAEILRANKKIRQLATAHRVSLGEVHKLRQYSQDTIEREEEREHNLTLDLDRLREENKRLHRELTLRDLSIAKSVTTEEESLRIGYWIQNQPFVPNSSSQVDKNDQPPETLEEEGKPDVKVGETPKQELKQWSDFAPPLKEEPWKEKRRESWEPNHEDVVEMLRKIKQLRDDVEHEKFMKGAAEEMVVQLEKELDQAHGSEAVDESSAVGDVQSTAAKRIAEIVGARAALKTSQQNYEKAQEECALLQKTCDGLEETIAEKDHRILILERDLKEAQKDLAQERGELMDAMLKIEDMETQLAECQKQLHSKTSEVSQLEYQVGVLIPDLNTTQAEREDLRHKNAVLEEKNYDLITDNVYKLQCAEHEETLRKLKEAELQEAKDELAEERIDYEASRIDFANNIRDLEESISEYKAEQDELRKQIDKHRTMVGELEVAISFRDLDLQIQRETIQELRQSNKSTMAAAKGLAEYPKSLRGEEGQQRFEELRRRCRRLKEQQVRWQREIREMAGKWLRAQLRYRHDHRALTKAYRDLERLQQQRHFDAERERLQLDQIASLEQECEDARLALQDAHLRLASAEEIGKTHDGEIEDVEGILPLGQDVPKDGETETVVDLSHTALPLPPVIQERIVTRERVVTREVKVEHHHSEACFCSLVEYWFPGALQTVLPRRQDTDDSGYGSGSVDGHDDSQGLGGTPENHDVPNDEDLEEYIPDPEVEEIPNESDRALHTYLHSPTDSADDAQPSPTTEKFPHEPTAQGFVIEQESTSSDEETCNNSPTQEDNENQDSNNAGFDDLEGPSLRGGAGSPDDTSTEPSAADYEVQMASFITKDDGWGGDEAEEPVEKEEDAVSETSFGPYQEQLDDDILYGSDDDLQTQSVEEDEDTAATPRPKFSRRTRPSIFEQFTESDEDTPATPRPKSSPKARQAGFEVIPAPRRRKFSRKPRQASLEDEDVTESDDDAFGLGLAQGLFCACLTHFLDRANEDIRTWRSKQGPTIGG